MEKKIILIIEDDRPLNAALEKKLVKEGYIVGVAFNGKEGIEKVKELKPNLVILDLFLPILSGYDVLKFIKENETTRHTKVYVLSNTTDFDIHRRDILLLADAQDIKAEVTLAEITEKVKQLLP